MAKITLLGVQDLDFYTDKGEHIEGIKLHCCYDDKNVFGKSVDKAAVFLPANLFESKSDRLAWFEDFKNHIGKRVFIDKDVKGRVDGIELLPDPPIAKDKGKEKAAS